ncbi:MAG: [FeFe] hydrogenase H-cluster radical SAM maturase HydE [Defluviitaleaceae bacterium]|nr:[FeFe] hydrogenase H-cluster radical SAM maturase HydE [Defluviitaleaceae bacterium]
MRELIDRLERDRLLTRDEFKAVLVCEDKYLHERAKAVRERVFGNKIYMRGLIEFTSYCKRNCYYCGLRTGNTDAQRYRLTKDEILSCCAEGYELGFRTFVLQGGEDPYYTDEILVDIVRAIKYDYADCAVTLSLGERDYKSLKRLRDAGADRYLLRQETSNEEHYAMLHPSDMMLSDRQKCLKNLKEIGYQVGCGFLIGSPGQTLDCIVDDLLFIKDLDPAMVGIGPFIPHSSTPFAGEKRGDLQLTLNTLAVLRLINPHLLIPATTALGSLEPTGREMGVLAGANVVMPNLSPEYAREKYMLYDNKICTDESAQLCRGCIGRRMNSIGCEIVVDRGDYSDV